MSLRVPLAELASRQLAAISETFALAPSPFALAENFTPSTFAEPITARVREVTVFFPAEKQARVNEEVLSVASRVGSQLGEVTVVSAVQIGKHFEVTWRGSQNALHRLMRHAALLDLAAERVEWS